MGGLGPCGKTVGAAGRCGLSKTTLATLSVANTTRPSARWFAWRNRWAVAWRTYPLAGEIQNNQIRENTAVFNYFRATLIVFALAQQGQFAGLTDDEIKRIESVWLDAWQ